jgi:serine/threonine protein kinase
MLDKPGSDPASMAIARHWCERKGPGWSVNDQLGTGGTAPVFEIASPHGLRALKIYDAAFSSGKKGEIELTRMKQQLALCGHECPSLVQVYEGDTFEERLYLLMSRAPGRELEKRLGDVPRNKIRHVVDQVARAALFLHTKNLCHRDIKAANIYISDDFNQVTLLDISVIRNIHDPVGAGSDHDGQLPVLATARYSPPEYLFRLLDPSPKLWHALNIYQFGGLMHDLIMKESLFQEEYLKSSENRYRFAWVVATSIPKIEADDIDQDLVFTARQALDKDWERRSVLRLQDFLADSNVQEERALEFLGLSRKRVHADQEDDTLIRLQRLGEVSGALQDLVLQRLRKKHVTAKHELKQGANDSSKVLDYRWDAPTDEGHDNSNPVQFQLILHLLTQPAGYRFRISAALSTLISGTNREVTMELPELKDDPGVETTLANQCESALAKLAIAITKPKE